VRDFHSLASALTKRRGVQRRGTQAGTGMRVFSFQAAMTNIIGPENIVRAIQNTISLLKRGGISTDKACKPVNVMGMTKAIQERVFIRQTCVALIRVLFVYAMETYWLRAVR